VETPPPPPPPPSDPWAAAVPAAPPAAVCYRHPDRPTRLACSSCGRPTCVDCTVPAAVGQKCPECAAPVGRSRVITASEVRSRTSGLGGAPVTRAILVVTAAIGVLAFAAPAVWSPLARALIDDVALVADGQVWRTVTAALLHDPGSPFHIIFNMYALYAFGPSLERRVGSVPFLVFYLAAAAAGGAAFQAGTERGSALGASGAIFGLFGAYLTLAFLSRHTAAGRASLNQLLPLLLINLALPLFVPGIAWQAHLGGLVAGAGIAAAWRRTEGRAPQPGRGGTAVRAGVAAGVLVLCLALAALV
jgi:membrane associated rhomboid family serine protease